MEGFAMILLLLLLLVYSPGFLNRCSVAVKGGTGHLLGGHELTSAQLTR